MSSTSTPAPMAAVNGARPAMPVWVRKGRLDAGTLVVMSMSMVKNGCNLVLVLW
jgi:hypothetical protein